MVECHQKEKEKGSLVQAWRNMPGSVQFIVGSIGILYLGAIPFVLIPALNRHGALPWMATPVKVIDHALKSVKNIDTLEAVGTNVKNKLKLIDLGSGDGRICITAAKNGFEATGIERNPILVGLSYYNAWKYGVLDRVEFKMKDLWKVDLSTYDVVTVFGVQSMMTQLHSKFRSELKNDVKIISYRFPIHELKPIKKQGEIYIYKWEDIWKNIK